MNPDFQEEAVWTRLKQGDKTALEEIYHHHIQLLYGYGKKFCSDSQLVEDSIHDLFVEIWEKRQNLGATNSVTNYLLTSLRRKVIRYAQKQQKQSGADIQEVHDEKLQSLDREQEITLMETKLELQEDLKNAMEALSERQREAVYLRYQVGLDYKKIAEIMDIHYQSVRNLIHQAVKILRKNMVKTIVFLLGVIFLS